MYFVHVCFRVNVCEGTKMVGFTAKEPRLFPPVGSLISPSLNITCQLDHERHLLGRLRSLWLDRRFWIDFIQSTDCTNNARKSTKQMPTHLLMHFVDWVVFLLALSLFWKNSVSRKCNSCWFYIFFCFNWSCISGLWTSCAISIITDHTVQFNPCLLDQI